MIDGIDLSPQKRLLLQRHLSGSGGRPEPIERRQPGAPAPMSAEQKNVWLHAAMAADVPLYNEALTIHRFGAFDRAALERAFSEILQRHEIWRTSFHEIDGQLRQIVHFDIRIDIPLIDLSQLPEAERERAALEIATADTRQLFDPSRVPLWRAKIVRLTPDLHRLYLVLHHIIFDGVSIYKIILPELTVLYAAFASGREPDARPLRLQYGDYARWREREIAGYAMNRDIAYWRAQLAGDPPAVQLPTDRPRPERPSYLGGMETFELSKEITADLKTISRNEGVTLYVVLLAAFKALLHRYSGQEDIVIGGVTDMRRRPELADVVGYFLNSLALRSHPTSTTAFRDYLREVEDTVIGALDASSVPFDRVVREIQPRRTGGTHPLFQILFSVEPPAPTFDDGWDLTQMDVTAGVAKFDLYLELDERPSGIIGRFLYSSDLFDASTIRRMIGHWTTLLGGIVANPGCALGRLPLAEQESKRLLNDINATQRKCRPGTLPDWFDLQALATPDSPAVECGGRTWSYRDLRERADQLMVVLRRAGAERGCLVGLLVERSFDMVAGLVAILRSGAAYLPLDPQLPQARLDMPVADAKPLILLTQKSLLDRIANAQAKIVLCEDASPSADRFDAMDLRCDPDDLAYVLYTSGSAGRPKAVEVRHRSLANLLAAMQDHLHLGTQDVLLAVTTLSFDIAALELFLPLVTGSRVSVASREEAMEPGRLVELLLRSRATVMQATPATWRGLIAAGWLGCPKLKILCGGETLQSHLAHQLADRGEAVWNLYGPTETTIWSLIHKVRREDNPVPIGKPLANTQVYVLDAGGEPVPIGIAGELYIGGAGVARGYCNDPGLTEQKFCILPALSSNSLYRTGDMVRFREDGLLEFLGRVDNQVKVRGFRVGLEEVEAAICAHPGIAAAAVRAFGDASGESALAAFVVPKTPSAHNANLRTLLGETLPGYMVPTRFVFVSSLPTTANGKLDRAKLPVPQESGVRHAAEARDELERMLARLWVRLLGISVPDVHDNFFDLGGHSLLAAMLMAEIRKETGRELPLAALFRAPTIASLADLLRTYEGADFSHLVGLKSEGSGQPLFIVHGIFGNVLQLRGLAANMETDRPIYALQARGADLRQQPHATIAEMASAYIEAIRAVQTAGGYALAGYSFGGLIAFEMARRLSETGEEIDLLMLFETDVSHRNLHPAEWLSSQWMVVRRNLRRLSALPPRQWMHFFMSRAAVLWRRLVWGRDFMRELDDASQDLPDSVRARNREMYNIGAREFAAYRPRYYPGTIAVFRTADPGDPLPFWRKVADRVDVFDIAGEHGTIMDNPNVTRLAAELSRCLAAHDYESTNPLRCEQSLQDGAMVAPLFGNLGEPAI